MTEEQETLEKPKRSPWHGVKVFFICMAVLAVFVPVFGKLVPRLLFAPEVEKPVEKLEKPEATSEAEAIQQPLSTEIPAETPAPEQNEITKIDDERVKELQEKIEQLQSELAAKSTLIAFGEMKSKIIDGKPYAYELNQLKNSLKNSSPAEDIIKELEKNADSAAITKSAIGEQFSKLIKPVIIGESQSYGAKFLQKFVTIRKVGEQVGTSDEAVIARAEAKLAAGEIAAALAELSALSEQGQEIFAPWKKSAQSFLDTQNKLDELQTIVRKQ